MTEQTPAPAGRFLAPEAARRPSRPCTGTRAQDSPAGSRSERVAALVELRLGRRRCRDRGPGGHRREPAPGRDARAELAATVPPELLRQVLIARANSWTPTQSGHDGQPAPEGTGAARGAAA